MLAGVGVRSHGLQESKGIAHTMGCSDRELWRGQQWIDGHNLLQQDRNRAKAEPQNRRELWDVLSSFATRKKKEKNKDNMKEYANIEEIYIIYIYSSHDKREGLQSGLGFKISDHLFFDHTPNHKKKKKNQTHCHPHLSSESATSRFSGTDSSRTKRNTVSMSSPRALRVGECNIRAAGKYLPCVFSRKGRDWALALKGTLRTSNRCSVDMPEEFINKRRYFFLIFAKLIKGHNLYFEFWLHMAIF
jgi:hypothetical protein